MNAKWSEEQDLLISNLAIVNADQILQKDCNLVLSKKNFFIVLNEADVKLQFDLV